MGHWWEPVTCLSISTIVTWCHSALHSYKSISQTQFSKPNWTNQPIIFAMVWRHKGTKCLKKESFKNFPDHGSWWTMLHKKANSFTFPLKIQITSNVKNSFPNSEFGGLCLPAEHLKKNNYFPYSFYIQSQKPVGRRKFFPTIGRIACKWKCIQSHMKMSILCLPRLKIPCRRNICLILLNHLFKTQQSFT